MNTRMLQIGGALFIVMGITWMLPVVFEWSSGTPLSALGKSAAWAGPVMVVAGVIMLARSRSRSQMKPSPLPAPVRMIITVTVLFLGFCSLEFSDGLVRQDGRVFYWTSVLFPPALIVLYGLVSARKWAWRATRVVAGFGVIWFVGVSGMIPFSDVQAQGEPVPFWGRVWMIGVSLVFAGTSFLMFRQLGLSATRRYFGMNSGAEEVPNAPIQG